MVLVDTTVWVDHLKNTATPEVAWLRAAISNRTAAIAVGDLVLCEVLQGLSTEREAALVEQALRRFDVLSLVSPDLAAQSAAHYRTLRRRGVTVRKTIDMLIGTFCIAHGYALLHADRDFDQLERHLGLRVVHPWRCAITRVATPPPGRSAPRASLDTPSPAATGLGPAPRP